MPQSQLQPAPFRVPLLNESGQMVEVWRRFFLSTQVILDQILNGQIPFTPLGGGREVPMEDVFEADLFPIPGPAGLIGPTGQPGLTLTLGEEATTDGDPFPTPPGFTGILPVPSGGTGGSTFTTNGVLYGAAATAIQATSQGPTNSVLIANAGAPSFSATPTVTTLTTTGAATVGGLTDLSGASAGQVKFPATQNPSSNVNTLDDYEEGTWTPTDGSGAGLSFTNPAGSYVKIGQAIYVTCSLTYPVTANGNNMQIDGLPFTADAIGAGLANGYVNTTFAIMILVRASTAHIEMFSVASGLNLTNAQMSGVSVFCSGVYRGTA